MKVKYLIVPMIFSTLMGPPVIFSPRYGQTPPALNSLFSFIFAVVSAYLIYWGIKKCYLLNRQIDSKAFFERIILLSLPITVRLVVFMIPTSIALLVLLALLRDQFPGLLKRASIIFSALGPVVLYVNFVMLESSFRRLGRLIAEEAEYIP